MREVAKGDLLEFLAWARQPCPTGEWLFRGQSADVIEIVPSILRPRNSRFFRDRLHELSPDVAIALLRGSSVLGVEGLYDGVVNFEFAADRDGFASYLYEEKDGAVIQFSECIRALAQHYGHPTLYLDLTRDARVAAAFACHSWGDDGYRDAVGPGVVYRWPATRTGVARLNILMGKNAHHLAAIDISGFNRFVRRPRNQQAVLVAPYDIDTSVTWDRQLMTPGAQLSLQPTLETLPFVEMSQLPCCEVFELPAGCAAVLREHTGVSMDALFPDQIDLGYSYVALGMLLSISVHSPSAASRRDPDQAETVLLLDQYFQSGLDLASAILERESLRIVPDFQLQAGRLKRTWGSIVSDMESMVDTTLWAASRMNSAEDLEQIRVSQTEQSFAILNEMVERGALHESVILDARRELSRPDRMGVALNLEQGRLQIHVYERSEEAGADWVSDEIKRRTSTAREILHRAQYVPAYAYEHEERDLGRWDALERDEEYDEAVKRQTAACARFRPDEPVFALTGGLTHE